MASSSTEGAADNGFERADMYKDALAGTVHHYEKHVFLCYKDPQSWPSHLETSQDDDFPRLFAASLKARKSDTPKKTRLTISDATESSEGDVLIFPDMVCYKGLTTSDIENFVEEVLVKESDYFSERKETLQGAHIFVCAHARRDMRCGVCGPALIDCFKKEIADRGIADGVFVKSCSHVGGHKYAGNVIIYSSDANGEIAGHWYGYVTPKDVTQLLDEHIGKGKIINKLWRGQMGLSEEEQKKAYQQWAEAGQSTEEPREACPCSQVKEEANGPTTGCCKNKSGSKGSQSCWSCLVSCFDSWEKGDTLAALAVVSAVSAVAVAFTLSRHSS
ncbi:hypothetical protein GOP47_0028693 [Adiantum capillus-veneris]|nr:hypothetical protein GOP47_0028693 [Adiantum capillus-veneris]